MKRHGVPATLTSTGRIASTWIPGEADRLTGRHRWVEVWTRFRQQHPRFTSARLLVAAWRHGVVLGGPAMSASCLPSTVNPLARHRWQE
jgi:hypothetical protein